MAYDRSVAPYTAVHLASLLPRTWHVEVIHEMVRDVDVDMPVDVVFLSTMDFCAPHARWLARQFRARGVMVVVGVSTRRSTRRTLPMRWTPWWWEKPNPSCRS